ncbi:cordon-bleu protein-like 1 isoform X2 [Tachyglossus aculeatus]|uniref:cordon-bleu protein-like 1 isoform X2 n=1 Tax=Tachyglossus aculeatus TaxID=9261 RepID=UPI0018F622B7|nr:cordon-bleu protein-like 1 isoform X2 [Tachyglossus aculeatus]
MFGRKTKAKAPLPPDVKYTEGSSLESMESPNFTMEQKENMIDKDIELSVVLPGDVIKSTVVHGRKPMMDLFIFLCAQYHLNPSSYTIDLMSPENNPVKFKPNTPIGMLEVERVILKPKNLDKKKPTPLVPEQTVRMVINYKKTQKTIVRVSPHASLQELAPIICNKCEFDPSHTILLRDYQSQEPLDLTKSLNDLGLRELYAMDVSGESCQISPNLDILKEKENKRFFSFFQRSKKKREQTASAPATPLISKPRPTFMRSNTISKPFVSNTLPSDMPKKRRAPLPPMSASESAPQERPAAFIVKSVSVDETNTSPSSVGIVRTGSLHLSSTSSANSSLRRTKRKAPSPPSKTSQNDNDENGNITALQAAESVPVDGTTEVSTPEVPPIPAGINPEYSLEEIDEKEELYAQQHKADCGSTAPKSQEVSPCVSTGGALNTEKKDLASALVSSAKENSEPSEEEKQESRNTDGKGPGREVDDLGNEETVLENRRHLRLLRENSNDDKRHTRSFPVNTEEKSQNGVKTVDMIVADATESNKFKTDGLSDYRACKNDISESFEENSQVILRMRDQKLNQTHTAKVKTQDAAIQTTPVGNSRDWNMSNETTAPQDHHSSAFGDDGQEVSSNINQPALQTSSELPASSDASKQFKSQGTTTEETLKAKIPSLVCMNDTVFFPVEGADKTPTSSSVKNYPFYRQDSKPKPKPANEITRDYIPKIGMTTYKIVPPKSLEILKDGESETIVDNKDYLETTTPEYTQPCWANWKEPTKQTEELFITESTSQSEIGLKCQTNAAVDNQRFGAISSIADGVLSSPPKLLPGDERLKIQTSEMNRYRGTTQLILDLEKVNALRESRGKNKVSTPQEKPSSFFLQMQKRVSGHYVTSAVAKSANAATSPTQSELKNKDDVERNTLPEQEQTLSPLNKTMNVPPELSENKLEHDSERLTIVSPPPKPPKPLYFPNIQSTALNLKTLKTFGAPKPYSSSAPSPFALAVVKRSRSFNKACPITSQSAGEELPVTEEKNCSVDKLLGILQHSMTDQEVNCGHGQQRCQVPSSTDHPSSILKRQTSLPSQTSDPEQVRQSLLTAIRSGEAAAKLKRVTVPSNTISVNGRTGLNYPVATESQYSH